jgi:hypothetical protein
MVRTPKADTLVRKLERAVLAVLDDDKASAQDKLRAIDVGAKILQIKHKLAAGGDDGGNYFGS